MFHSRFGLILFYSHGVIFSCILCRCCLFLHFFVNYDLPSVSSFIYFSGQWLCSHFPLPDSLLTPSPIAFRLISPAHSFFSRSQVQLFRPLNLRVYVRACVCLRACVYIKRFVCDGSNIMVAILLKNPWRNERKGKMCFIWWSVFPINSILLPDSASPAAPPWFMHSRRNRCMSSCARYTYLHLCAWLPLCVSTADMQAGVKNSSDKLIIFSWRGEMIHWKRGYEPVPSGGAEAQELLRA